MSVNTTPATWAAGEIPTAAKMNTEIRDFAAGSQAAWDTYTPLWTATTTSPTLGNGTMTGSYNQVGKTVRFRIRIVLGSTTTVGSGTYFFTLPVTSTLAASDVVCFAALLDSSAPARAARTGIVNTASTFFLLDNAGIVVSNAAPWVWASGDIISITGVYEAA
jgi:hypothetical protein